MKKICVNIWDDYLDDEDSNGNDQHTYMYVEELPTTFSLEEQELLLELIFNFVKSLKFDSNISFILLPTESECRPEILIKNISHKNRELLLDTLIASDLSNYINFYSES